MKIQIDNYGLYAEHNMPCPIYYDIEKAVYNCNTGMFNTSWKAQADGYRIIKCKGKLRNWLIDLLTGAKNK